MEKLQRVVFQLGDSIKVAIETSVENVCRQPTSLECDCVKHITDVRDYIMSVLNDSIALDDPMVSDGNIGSRAHVSPGTGQFNEHSADGLEPCLSPDRHMYSAAWNRQVHDRPVESQSPGEAVMGINVKMPCSADPDAGSSCDQGEPFSALERETPLVPAPFVQTVFSPTSATVTPGVAFMAAQLTGSNSDTNGSMNTHRQYAIRGVGLCAAPMPSDTEMFISRKYPATTTEQLTDQLK